MTASNRLIVTLTTGEGRAIIAEIHPTADGKHSVRIACAAGGGLMKRSAEFTCPQRLAAFARNVQQAIAEARPQA